jgi:tetratricopeptide (TPR) repeat protein
MRLSPLATSFALLLTCATPALLLVAPTSTAHAQDKPSKKGEKGEKGDKGDKGEKGEKGDKKGKSSGGPRTDPNNLTGISPLMEKLAKGHKLISARDFPGAIEAYRGAVTEDDKNPLGHYYLGAAQLLKGDLNEADASWQTALRNAGNDEVTASKIRFAIADLRERQAKLDDSKAAWQDYAKYATEHPKPRTYPASAGERQKVIDTWQDLQKKYGEVKARIAARDKELKDKAAAEAAKDAAEEDKKGPKKKLSAPVVRRTRDKRQKPRWLTHRGFLL